MQCCVRSVQCNAAKLGQVSACEKHRVQNGGSQVRKQKGRARQAGPSTQQHAPQTRRSTWQLARLRPKQPPLSRLLQTRQRLHLLLAGRRL